MAEITHGYTVTLTEGEYAAFLRWLNTGWQDIPYTSPVRNLPQWMLALSTARPDHNPPAGTGTGPYGSRFARAHAPDCECNLCIGAPAGLPSEQPKYA